MHTDTEEPATVKFSFHQRPVKRNQHSVALRRDDI